MALARSSQGSSAAPKTMMSSGGTVTVVHVASPAFPPVTGVAVAAPAVGRLRRVAQRGKQEERWGKKKARVDHEHFTSWKSAAFQLRTARETAAGHASHLGAMPCRRLQANRRHRIRVRRPGERLT